MQKLVSIRLIGSFILLNCLGIHSSQAGDIQNEKDKIDSIRQVGWKLLYQDPELVIELSNDQLEASENIKYYEGLYLANYQLGMAYNNLHVFDQSVKSSFKALEILESHSLKNRQKRKINIYKNIGLSYFETYGYLTTKDYYNRALEIAIELNDSSHISSIYYNLGITEEKLSNHKQALNNYSLSLEYLPEENQKKLSVIYNSMGNVYSALEEYNVSNMYYRKAIEFSQDEKRSSYYVSNLGENFYKKSNYDSAIYYYNTALALSQKFNDQDKINWIHNNLGDVYLKKGEHQEALSFYTAAYQAYSGNKINEEYRRSCKNLSIAYELMGDFQNALKYNDLFLAQDELLQKTKEKLHEQNSIYQMKEMEWQMERQAKDEQIALSQNIILFLKLASIALIIILSIATYQAIKYYKGIRQVKKWLATE